MRRRLGEVTPRRPEPIYALMLDEVTDEVAICQLCGEKADVEMGEFGLPDEIRKPNDPLSLIGHGQCGLDHGLEIA